ncbi:LOB domain-containing protein 24-like [Telopea speciosissima]|uniref:LOB domain-containing protein 24-like n=1 Tax=Telopea speciosissima TaxID=54955 RepID=UPI001CC63159|nr:LOB domain-containing protein 24-like [Telopea speciosissima]
MNGERIDGRGKGCAACKQRKIKCDERCLLSPYFPQSRQEDFIDVQKHYGVSSINKILNKIEPEQRNEAIKSIVLESKARKNDPVNGIVGIIHKLQSQIKFYENEIAIVNQQLTYCKQREKHIFHQQKEQIEQLTCYQKRQKEQIKQLLKNQQFLCSELLASSLSSSSSSTSSQLLKQFDDYNYQMRSLPADSVRSET